MIFQATLQLRFASGTTLAYLTEEAYVPFVDAITRPPDMFATVNLNFSGGTSMFLRPQDYLLQQNSVRHGLCCLILGQRSFDCGFDNEMALAHGFIMAITFLQDINSEKDKWTIKVKVVSLWKQYYANTNPPALASMDMIFKDELGTTIHATIRAGFISDFDKLLQENSDFLISNFSVKKNIDGTKLTPHQYKLHFLKKTNVRHCQDFKCAADGDGLQLLSFQDFNNTTFDTAYAFDVIGRLINNKDITVLNGKNGSKKSSLEFELQDLKYRMMMMKTRNRVVFVK
ncbi:replication protein A 70 kDa DNA-binding subunit D [Tanacetum coccineum]